MNVPERIIPDETEPGIVALHLKRYEFARPYAEGKDVLDAGCGVGYGTAFLAETARRAVGVDISRDAIAYARRRYGAHNVRYEIASRLMSTPTARRAVSARNAVPYPTPQPASSTSLPSA